MGAYDDILGESAQKKQKRGAYDDILENESKPNPFSLNTDRVNTAGRTLKDFAGGLPRSGMGIASNLLRPFEALIPGGNDGSSGHTARMNRVDARFKAKGYDPQSTAFQVGKLVGDVAITAPVGGALAAGAKFIPGLTKTLPGIDSALRTGGLRLGGNSATTAGQIARNAATRVGAGATVGGISAGIIDPETAGTGAMIGAALPPAIAFAGSTGRAIKAGLIDPLVNHKSIIGDTLVRTVGADNLGQLSANVAPKTPGVNFSLAQRTGSPGIAAIEDTVKAINPGGELSLQAGRNRQVLADSMRELAKDEEALAAAIQARENATNALYEQAKKAVMQDDGSLAALLKRPSMKTAMQNAVGLAKERGEFVASKVKPQAQRMIDTNKDDILMAVRKMGGMSQESFDSMFGQSVRNGLKFQPNPYGPVFSKAGGRGKGVDEIASELYQKGYLEADDVGELLDKVVDTGIHGKPVFSVFREEAANDPLTDAIQQLSARIGEKNATPVSASMLNKGTITGKALHDIKMGLDDAIGTPGVGGLTGEQRRMAMDTKAQFMGLLESRIPEYAKARSTYEDLSRPINQMQVGQRLANTFIPPTSGDMPASLNAASLARALRNKNQVARIATQFPGARFNKVLTPEQIAMVTGVSDDASRIAEMGKLGAGFGSPTARRQSLTNFVGDNLVNEVPVLSRAVGMLGNVPGLNIPIRAAGAVADAVGGKINQSMITQLETMLANNPDEVIKLMQSAATRQAVRRGLADERIYAPALRAMLFASPASQANQ